MICDGQYIGPNTENCLNETYRNVYSLTQCSEMKHGTGYCDMITRYFYAHCLPHTYITVTVPLFRKEQGFPLNDTPLLDLTS